MATEIVMPRLGWTMEEGTLVEWIKHDGDPVKVGDIMFVVESDKALNEVESFEDGIFRIPPGSDVLGKTLPVGTILAYVTKPGEPLPFDREHVPLPDSPPAADEFAAIQQAVQTTPPLSKADLSSPSVGSTRPTISPRARRVAQALGVDWVTLNGSGRTGRIVERDVRAAAKSAERSAAQISPVARRAADELGVNVEALAAQMPGQRITREHVERAAQPVSAVSSPAASAEVIRVPLSRVRQVIAERMTTSAHTTAPVTLTTEVDATELVNVRQGLKAAGQADTRPVPSYNDLMAKLVAEVLREHPQLNARIEGDDMVLSDAVHMGFAVDTERGLLVPVVRNIGRKTVRQIAEESAVLVERARNNSLRSEDLAGGTFTITNLGMYEIDAFTPIINLPQCAILGIGRIVPKQVVIAAEAERVAIRQMLFLSLTFDHRLVDGAPAARFLQQVKRYIEQPYLWLLN